MVVVFSVWGDRHSPDYRTAPPQKAKTFPCISAKLSPTHRTIDEQPGHRTYWEKSTSQSIFTMGNNRTKKAISPSNPWEFWIDRGGTFTDIIAQDPSGQITVHKLLSENPDRYSDAAIQGIRDILQLDIDKPIPPGQIAAVKMGTTVATNALLERKGDPTLLLITKGFQDALRIGYQNRPRIFDLHIVLPEMLYAQVIEVEERHSAQGEVLMALQINEGFITKLQNAYNSGIRSCAIALLHGYRYPSHEVTLAEFVRGMGFTQVSVSHQVSPLMKLISRGDTTVVDAYLSPILRRYVQQVETNLGKDCQLLLMQSNGGLITADRFQGKDSILSGPAGGIVGAVKTSAMAGFDRIIGFDMGGTSTDVSHFNRALNGGQYERTLETEVAGVRLLAPMMAIHTVAAGGGSILRFDGARYLVGPESAGAYPGPACYRNDGPLTVTDCNVLVGKLQPAFFPAVFGAGGDLPIDRAIVQQKFTAFTTEINQATGGTQSPEEVAAGFLTIAIDKMARAIKKISVQRGYDITDYTLCCFGGAGGQHACLIAEALGIKQIFLHPYAGVLSAYGMGLADLRVLKERAIELPLTAETMPTIEQHLTELEQLGRSQIATVQNLEVVKTLQIRPKGTDVPLGVPFSNLQSLELLFKTLYHQRYGFTITTELIIESATVEVISKTNVPQEITRVVPDKALPIATIDLYTKNAWHRAPVYDRTSLTNTPIPGPAIILEPTGTNIIEPNWTAHLTQKNYLILSHHPTKPDNQPSHHPTTNPILLEIFNNLFSAIAQEMGITLQNTSQSVNIKERLDFSCAIFDNLGQLVANAPHIPVHLGSMGESVLSLIAAKTIHPGDVYISNNPYNGGTHLPDITVITPVFETETNPLFYVASRGHHADIGGITPGSMPPHSVTIDQEGILFDNFHLVSQGKFRTAELLEKLQTATYPARNPQQNISDLQAQIAANERGVNELLHIVSQYGLSTVQTYMQHVQDNAERAVREAIERLQNGTFTYPTDEGSQIQVAITIDKQNRTARIDFTGTSPQQSSNFNAPLAVCKAAVLYVFRTIINDSDIPLNAGCLKPLEIIVPAGSMLNPKPPAAVVAGNVETSQAIVDAIYGALGILAASQGTMNNFTFGNQTHQYYETICGGSGAGPGFSGTDAVQTHMTNSRLTDPEILEWRFPVLVEDFRIRQNSGGLGQYAGGNGVIRRIQFRESMTAAILSGHRLTAPFGLNGGQPGQVGRNYLVRSKGNIEPLPSKAEVEMAPGDSFVIETPGGGGYGPC